MKRLLFVLLLGLACCSSKNDNPGYLYMMHAEEAKFEKILDRYDLIMEKVDDKVTYFTERPDRKAGFMKTSYFIGHWNKGDESFKEDPPNASIHAIMTDTEGGQELLHIVELTAPMYDPVNKTVRFTVRQIDSNSTIQPKTVTKVTLMIDRGAIGPMYGHDSLE